MKKMSLFLFAVIVLVLSFSSCKKDEKNLEKPELGLGNNTTGITALYLSHEVLSIIGKVSPADAPDNKIKIKITTAEDPTGFEIELTTKDGDFTEGKNRYLYKEFSTLVYAANHTNAQNKKIKVNNVSDNIKVVVGNNIIEKTFPVNSKEVLKYTYWSSDASGSLFLYGYNFNGTEAKTVNVWSTRDNQEVTIAGIFNDPTLYQALPSFTTYSFNVNFNDGWSYPADTLIGVYPEGDTIFIRYNNKTYSTPYNLSTSAPMQEN